MDEDPIRELERQVDKMEYRVAQHEQLHVSDFRALHDQIKYLRADIEEKVNMERYQPVEKLVFGTAVLILVAVVTSVIALVVGSPT